MSSVSFFSQYLFPVFHEIPVTQYWMVTSSCSGCSYCRSSSHLTLVLCDASLSRMSFQYFLVSVLGGSNKFLLFPLAAVFTFSSSLEMRQFILLAFASLIQYISSLSSLSHHKECYTDVSTLPLHLSVLL